MDRGRGPEDLRVVAQRLGQILSRRFNLRFHWNPSPVLGHEHLVLTGEFYPDEDHRPTDIWLNSHPVCRFYRFGRPGRLTWHQFVCNLSECIMHEKVHELQDQAHQGEYRTLPETGDKELDYYLDPDEIDAYAWSLASECCDQKGLESLVDPQDEWSSWWNYANILDPGHPARRRLLKKTYRRICQAQEFDRKQSIAQ